MVESCLSLTKPQRFLVKIIRKCECFDFSDCGLFDVYLGFKFRDLSWVTEEIMGFGFVIALKRQRMNERMKIKGDGESRYVTLVKVRSLRNIM